MKQQRGEAVDYASPKSRPAGGGNRLDWNSRGVLIFVFLVISLGGAGLWVSIGRSPDLSIHCRRRLPVALAGRGVGLWQ